MLYVMVALMATSFMQGTTRAADTLGSDLSAAPTGGGACTECTHVMTSLPGRSVSAPYGGVIVRWRIMTNGSQGANVKLRVLRSEGGSIFTGVRTSSTESVTPGASSFVFSTRLAIGSGEYIGLNRTSGLNVTRTLSGAQSLEWSSGLADGASEAGSLSSDTEVVFNADIERDADGDGYGDESQDSCPADATVQGACPGGSSSDTTAPEISKFKAKPKRFRVKKPGTTTTAKQRTQLGTTLSYTLSEDADVTFTVKREVAGRKVGSECKRPTEGNRKKKRCSRYKDVATFSQSGVEGENKKVFAGRIGSKVLRPDDYRVEATAKDAAGNTSSSSATVSVTLVAH